MTEKAKENLNTMQSLGINTKSLLYDECVSILLDKYIEVSMSLEYNAEEVFRKELERIQKPNN